MIASGNQQEEKDEEEEEERVAEPWLLWLSLLSIIP